MKPIQLALIGVALVAALGAGFVMLTMTAAPEALPVVIDNTPRMETKRVLVAGQDIPMGTELSAERLTWQEWPVSGLREEFITEEKKPEAIEEMATAIARNSFFGGEPIREQKLVRSDSGYLSAILPSGKQAVAIRVSAESGAGGFILPNDHVDVIMTFRNQAEEWITERVLENVRVLAIDQVIEEEGGEKARVGDTATLELTPDQASIASVATQMSNGNLTLALRSVEDSGSGETNGATNLVNGNQRGGGNVRLIRFGQAIIVRKPN